ncbi:hypothetical protein [Dactylosporangium sp. NPDC051541]|uniref:hypothetical protein n=1 Tax=Dactylosporangium sp. NPDC051541 TaxID=3363977 RepID=UPI00378E135F
MRVTIAMSNLRLYLPSIGCAIAVGATSWAAPSGILVGILGMIPGASTNMAAVILPTTICGAAAGIIFLFGGMSFSIKRPEIRTLLSHRKSMGQSSISRIPMVIYTCYVATCVYIVAVISALYQIFVLMLWSDATTAPASMSPTWSREVANWILTSMVIVGPLICFVTGSLVLRRLTAVRVLLDILTYQGEAGHASSLPRVFGSLFPVIDPVGSHRRSLAALRERLEKHAQTYELLFSRLGSSAFISLVLRATVSEIRTAAKSRLAIDGESLQKLADKLRRLVVVLIDPGATKSAIELAQELGVYTDAGLPNENFVVRPSSRLVAFSGRFAATLDHVERPIKLVKLVGTVASIALALFVFTRHWDLSVLAGIK